MGMWDWFRHRRRSHRLVETSAHQQNSGHYDRMEADSLWLFSSYFNTRGHAFPMIRSCPPPKCLSRLPCSQILLGERLEDFSPDCWLENHLHRFGETPTNSFAISGLDNDDDSITGSSENDHSAEPESDHSGGTFSDLDSVIFRERPRLHIEELFMSPEERDAVIDSPSGYRQVVEPPPYSDFPNDPPPTYAEAVGHETDRGSIGGRSSSNDSTFLW